MPKIAVINRETRLLNMEIFVLCEVTYYQLQKNFRNFAALFNRQLQLIKI